MSDLGSPVQLGASTGPSRIRTNPNQADYGSYYGSAQGVDPNAYSIVPGQPPPNAATTSGGPRLPPQSNTPTPQTYTGVMPGQGKKRLQAGPPRPDRLPVAGANIQGTHAPAGGWDPNSGQTEEEYKAERRAYRAQFAEGTPHTERENMEDAAILAANPQTEQELIEVLHSLGIYDEPERGRSRFRSIMMDFKGAAVAGTNYHVDANGNMYDVATSDTDPNSPTANGVAQPISANIQAQLQRGFLGRLEDKIGVSTFQNWLRKGETGMVQDPTSGLWYNQEPSGNVTWWDEQGFQIDPQSGQAVGHYLQPGSYRIWGNTGARPGTSTSSLPTLPLPAGNPTPQPNQTTTGIPASNPVPIIPGDTTGEFASSYDGLTASRLEGNGASEGGGSGGGPTYGIAAPGDIKPGQALPGAGGPSTIPSQIPLTSGSSSIPAPYQAQPGYQPTGPSGQEQTMIALITDLARMLGGQSGGLFNIGAGDYGTAMDYFRTLLGDRAAMQASTAPAAENIAANASGARSAINSGYLRGGARDAALGELARTQYSDTAHLTQGVQPAAANALMSGGLAGMELATSQAGQIGQFYTSVLNTLTQGRLTEAGLAESSRQFETGLAVNSQQFAASLAEQIRGNNMSYNQGMAALSLQERLGFANLAMQAQQWRTQIEILMKNTQRDNKRYNQQRGDQKAATIGQLLVGGASAAAGAGAFGGGGGGTTAFQPSFGGI